MAQPRLLPGQVLAMVEVLTLALVAMAEPAVVRVRLAVLVVDFRLAVAGPGERRHSQRRHSHTPSHSSSNPSQLRTPSGTGHKAGCCP